MSASMQITFKVYGCEIIEEEKKSKPKDPLPDVEKAKREDLQKLQKSPFVPEPTSSPKQDTKQPQSQPATKSPAVEKKPEPRKPEVVYKTTGATTNNKIVERNQKNAKEKDCEIY